MTEAALLIGPGGEHHGAALAAITGLPAHFAQAKTFPDGEVCVRSPLPPRLETVFIVQGLHPPQDRRLQELYQLVEAARHQGVRRIICIVPYLAYARQDRRTAPGEPLSAWIVLKTLASLGAERLVAVEAHNPRIFADAPLAADNLSADGLFAGWIRRRALANCILVAPDAGCRERVERLAREIGVPSLRLHKTKTPDGVAEYDFETPALAGRSAVILDDLCSSGSTLIPLARRLLDSGAAGLHYACVHFFADAARIRAAIGADIEIVSADTVPNAVSAMPIAPLVAGWINLQVRAPSWA